MDCRWPREDIDGDLEDSFSRSLVLGVGMPDRETLMLKEIAELKEQVATLQKIIEEMHDYSQ